MIFKNKFITPILLILGLLVFVANQIRADASIEIGDYKAAWVTDFSSAKELAEQKGRPMLLEFTMSDWCPPCMRMKKEVFSQEAFLKYAHEKLVLVKLDFPRRAEQSPQLKAQNEALAQQFGIRGFPTVVLVSPEGDVINSEVGFRPGGAVSYVEHLKGVLAAK